MNLTFEIIIICMGTISRALAGYAEAYLWTDIKKYYAVRRYEEKFY